MSLGERGTVWLVCLELRLGGVTGPSSWSSPSRSAVSLGRRKCSTESTWGEDCLTPVLSKLCRPRSPWYPGARPVSLKLPERLLNADHSQ